MKTHALAITMLVVVLTADSRAGETLRVSKVRLDETDTAFMGAAAQWRIWRTSELVESTRDHRAQSFVHRFYIQRSADPKATLVHIENDTSVPFLCTVMPDRTFVLWHRGALSWHAADGGAHEHPKQLRLEALYQDGAVVETDDEKMCFVPFKGHSINMAEKIALGENCYRSGDKFAWIAKSTLHLYDLKSKERASVPLGAELHPSHEVTAFDRETVMVSVFVFDAKTGHLVGEKEYPKMPTRFAHVFAVCNRIGYYVKEGTLFATDLAAPEKQPVSLFATGQNPAYFQDEKGIHVWKNGKWTLVEWLEEFRGNDSENAEQLAPADARGAHDQARDYTATRLTPNAAQCFATPTATQFIIGIVGEGWAIQFTVSWDRSKIPTGVLSAQNLSFYRGPSIQKYIRPPAGPPTLPFPKTDA